MSTLIYFLLCLVLLSVHAAFGGYGGTLAKFYSAASEKNPSFLLTKLTFESDVPFSEGEFLYLTDLKVDSLVTKRLVDYAYYQLLAKRRFVHIDIDVQAYRLGKHLNFKLTGNWIFKKLDFRGIWFGKQEYASLYTQHPGDVFDAMLHEESVKAVKTALLNKGYFDCEVDDEIVYGKRRKTIVAKITVKRGRCFVIKGVSFNVESDEKAIKKEKKIKQRLAHELRVRFGPGLLNDSYSRSRIEKQVKKIRAFLYERGFRQVRISMTKQINSEKKTVELTFAVGLGKKRVLRFTGNTVFTDQQLNEEFLGEDQPDWLFTPEVIAEQLRHEYYKHGYWDVMFQNKKIADIGYEFDIKEGPVTTIEQIELLDSSSELPEPEMSFWPELLAKRHFDQSLLDSGIERMKKHYYALGYWDFKMTEKRFVKNYETGVYTIQILIDKGTQRLFGGIEIEGFKDLENYAFFNKYRVSNVGQHVPFNFDWLAEQRGFLLAHFQKLNYWYADVQPDLRLVDVPKTAIKTTTKVVKVVVVWKVKLGERVKFGKVFLRGITKLPFKTVLREVKFQEGDDWDKERLDLTRKKLKRLDVFKTVQLQPFQMAKNQSKKPVLLTLVDDDPFELRLRLGYFLTSKNFMFKQQSTPKVGTSFVVRNPTNRADKLSFDADWTRFERKLNVEYQQPSFFNYSVMSKIKGYTNKYIHPVRIGQSDSAYEAFQHGVLVGLSDEYKRDYHWGISAGNEWIRTSRVRGFLKLNKNLIDYTLPYFFFEPSLVIDKLDDRLNVKKGGLTFISLKCMVPEDRGIVTARLTAEQSLFYSVWEDIVIGARLRFGYMFRREFEDIMPIERFYLGGPYSVRGYEIDALPPLGVAEKDKAGNVLRQYTTNGDKTASKNKDVTKEYTIQGGSSMINGNLELRFPIYKSFGGVLFQDIGVLSQSGLAGFKSVWYPSSGVGLRYKTPIGALRFDIGWKWKRRLEHDSSYAWYLTIGEAF